MFHIELRQFPHNFCRFNLSEAELRAVLLDPWMRGETVELGERGWDPRQASLTVIEGPRLAMSELAMGRGWRNAARAGSEVTEQVLARAQAERLAQADALAPGREAPARVSARGEREEPEDEAPGPRRSSVAALAAELVALLGDDPLPLLCAWQLALERHPDRSPSECLALAEDLLRR